MTEAHDQRSHVCGAVAVICSVLDLRPEASLRLAPTLALLVRVPALLVSPWGTGPLSQGCIFTGPAQQTRLARSSVLPGTTPTNLEFQYARRSQVCTPEMIAFDCMIKFKNLINNCAFEVYKQGLNCNV